MKIPEPTRPSLSGYIQPGKLLPWSWVDARMERADNYWITTRSPGFPSSRPVWGLWRSPHLFFSTGSAISRHLGRDPRVQVNLESAEEVVLIEGRAHPVSDEIAATEWASEYGHKYHWEMPENLRDVWVVEPERVLAWLSDSSGLDGGAGFSNSATAWVFAHKRAR